jgi:hypothetical protein
MLCVREESIEGQRGQHHRCLANSEASIFPARILLFDFNIIRQYVPAYGQQLDIKERCDGND